ncbi:unnamed protein product [Lampetra planeri]
MDAILSQPSSASANPLLDEGLPTASSIPHGCSRTRTDRVAPTPQRLRSKRRHVPSGHVLSRLGVATGGVEESCHRCLLPLALVLLLVGAVVTALACHADGPTSVMGLFGVALMILAVFMLATGAISWCWRRGRGRAAPPEGRLGPARC